MTKNDLSYLLLIGACVCLSMVHPILAAFAGAFLLYVCLAG